MHCQFLVCTTHQNPVVEVRGRRPERIDAPEDHAHVALVQRERVAPVVQHHLRATSPDVVKV